MIDIALLGTALKLASQALAGLLFADFISGVLHWAEDRYGNPEWRILGPAIREAAQHHRTPRRILTRTWRERNGRVLVITGLFAVAFAGLGWINAFTLSALLFGALSNEIHARAHAFPSENAWLIRMLQRTGLLLSFQHHAAHHRRAKDTHFCVVTDWLNPVLEAAGVWRGAERVILFVTGIAPRDDAWAARHVQRPA